MDTFGRIEQETLGGGSSSRTTHQEVVKMQFALDQPGMGQGTEDFIPGGSSALPVTPTQSGSILDLIIGTGSAILTGITQPDMVKSAMNKYIYGVTNPTGSTPMPAPAPSMIAGIPNVYLLIGAAAVGLILLKKKR